MFLEASDLIVLRDALEQRFERDAFTDWVAQVANLRFAGFAPTNGIWRTDLRIFLDSVNGLESSETGQPPPIVVIIRSAAQLQNIVVDLRARVAKAEAKAEQNRAAVDGHPAMMFPGGYPLINRGGLKTAFKNSIELQLYKVIRIQGELGTGRTYTHHYFHHRLRQMKNRLLFRIEITAAEKTSQAWNAARLATQIRQKLCAVFPSIIDPNKSSPFKVQSFVGSIDHAFVLYQQTHPNTKVILFMDGFDEVETDDDLYDLLAQMGKWAEQDVENVFLILAGLDRDLKGFGHLPTQMKNFDDVDLEDFFGRFYDHLIGTERIPSETRESFIANGCGLVQKSNVLAAKPNVTAVGSKVKDLCQSIENRFT